MTPVKTEHIVIDESGVAWIRGANTKVKEVVLDVVAYGWEPTKIHEEHPHLSLGQIHAALSYYYDHRQDIDHQIKGDYEEVSRLRASARGPSIRKEVSEDGHAG